MKKILILVLATILISGCKKHQPTQISSEQNHENIYARSGSITVFHDMLSFPSMEVFQETAAELDNSIAEANEAFLEMYPNLPSNVIDSIADSIGFNEDQPLINFENSYSYTSLRQSIAEAEEAWLETDGENLELDPDNHFVVDETERTLLNHKAEVMIDGIIYIMLETGWVEIYNQDLTIVEQIENSTIDIYADPTPLDLEKWRNVNFAKTTQGSTTECDAKANIRDIQYKPNNENDKRIKCILSVWNNPWDHRAVAKVKSYKKKNGKWKKYNEGIWVRVVGEVVTNNETCEHVNVDIASDSYTPSIKTKNAKKLKAKAPINISYKAYVEKNKILGQFYSSATDFFQYELTW
jgi:hypothetical protein